jgi:acetoin utilization protein AcuB
VSRVSQLMSRNVVTVDPEASGHDAITLLPREKIRHLPVVGADGVLCGIVTDRDLRHHLFTPDVLRAIGTVPIDRLLSEVSVRQLMSAPVISVAPDMSLDQAAHVMLEKNLGSLPVVDHGKIVGILTETDVLRHIVGVNSCCPEFEAIVVSYP